MEKEKKRNKEDEEELDKKIALIREKNRQIEERNKEIEADRAGSVEQSPKKSPKPAQAPSTVKKTFSREWDHGKTPAETWRENVPSIEHTPRLAGRGGGQTGQRRQGHEQQKSSRLENRVSFPADSGRGRGRGGRRGGGESHREVQKRENGDITISIKNVDSKERTSPNQRQKKPDNRRKQRESRDSSDNKVAKPSLGDRNNNGEAPKKSKNRPRRESDTYAVRKVVTKLVDEVVRRENKQKKQAEKEKLQQSHDCFSSVEIDKTKVSEESPENVITLAKEKIVAVQIS